MKRIAQVALATFVLIVAGCSHNSMSPSSDPPLTTDQIQVQQLTANEDSSYFTIKDLPEEEMVVPQLQPVPPTLVVAPQDSIIVPVRWGRIVNSVTVNSIVVIDSSSIDSARVTITYTVSGYLRIMTVNHATIEKPFTDVYHRYGLYRRIGRTMFRHLNWELVRVSGIEGQTQGNNAVTIMSLTWYKKAANDPGWIQVGSTITDPLTFWQTPTGIPLYLPNDSMKVVVSVTGIVPFYGQLHYRPWQRNDAIHRNQFLAQNDSTYVVLGRVPGEGDGDDFAGQHLRRVFVDFMTSATLFDSRPTNYSANVWGLLYRVNGGIERD